MRKDMSDVFAVVLVGGKGKRLRPLSTASRPKPFLSITRDRKTLFKRTVERVRRIVPSGNIVVVANSAHARLVKKDLPGIEPPNLILEPVSRNTAPAITLAAFLLARKSEDAIMVILPADQYVTGEKTYLKAIKKGIDFIKNNRDQILVLAFAPKSPSTEYGYMRVRLAKYGARGVYKVERFVEKPNLDRAKRYLKGGRYLWNTGLFIFTAGTILAAVRSFAPAIYDGIRDFLAGRTAYDRLPDVSIDYTVMEKAANVYCVKGTFRWQDMGDFESLASILKRESRKFVLQNGKIIKIL